MVGMAPVWTLLERQISSGMRLSRTYCARPAQLHPLPVRHRDVVNQPRPMPDAVRPAILDGLPDGFLPVALAGVDGNIEILALDVMEGVHMFLGGIAALFTRQIKSHHSAVAEIHCEFRHLQGYFHIAHGADDQSRRNFEVSSSPLQPFEHGRDHVHVGQPLFGVENGSKPRLKVDHAIILQILHLLVGDPLQRLSRLGYRDGVGKAFQVARQVAAIGSLVEPVRQRLPDRPSAAWCIWRPWPIQ